MRKITQLGLTGRAIDNTGRSNNSRLCVFLMMPNEDIKAIKRVVGGGAGAREWKL